MNADDIRKILVTQAVEETDAGELVITAGEKRDAAILAGSPLGRKSRTAEQNTFLVKRAGAILSRVSSRFPEASRWADHVPAPNRFSFLALGLGVGAAIAGFLTNELGPEKRINILSFPLLGIILWSIVIYIREVFVFLRRKRGASRESWFDWLGDRLHHRPSSASSPTANGPAGIVMEGARLLFEKRWRTLNAPVAAARLKAILHATAFILAASAIGGMYVKGLANEYSAVWESTFFTDSAQLRPFLQLVLGPAAALSGEALPGTAELDAIHWSPVEGETPGENAARWIHWYALTVGLFVLIPRAILTLLWRVRSLRLSRTLPFRDSSPRYFERLLSTSTGSALPVHLVPYAFEPDKITKESLIRRLEDHFGRAVEVTWEKAVPFGEEEGFSLAIPEAAEEVIPLFNFSATPEKETHLAFHRTLSGAVLNPVRFALLDAAAFDRKSAFFADAGARRKGREEAWKHLFQADKMELILCPEAALPQSPSLS